MKIIVFAIMCSSTLLLTSCNENKVDSTTKKMADEALASNNEKNFTGTFTINGKSYKGRVSTQQFTATGQFSVLCQDDDTEPNSFKLIQFVFKNETVTRAGGDFVTVHSQGTNQLANEVSVDVLGIYRSQEDSKGSFKVIKNGDSNELVFENVKLESLDKEKKIVSGKIPF